MLTYIILAISALILMKIIYSSIIKPYKLYRFYKNQLKAKNIKSYNVQFIPFIAPSVINSMQEVKKYRDGYHAAKFEGPNYDCILTNLASQIALILISPEMVQQFYMLDGTPTYMKQQEFIRSLKRIVKTSITFSQGEVWKNKRRFMTSFFNFNQINRQFKTMVNIVNRKLAQAAQNRDQFEIYLLQMLEQMTSATMVELFFGGGTDDIENLEIEGVKVSTFMRGLVQHLGEQTLDPLSFMISQKLPEKNLRAKDRLVTRQVQKFKQFTTNFVKNRIYEIKQGKCKKQDYVKKIYESVPQSQRNQQFISKIVYDFSSLYIAGTDTTSHSAMMVVYNIIMHPEVRVKLEQEIEKFIKSDDDLVYDTVKNMIYLECVIHEGLRVYQPANGIFIREATQDHMLGNVKILKGTLILTSSLSNHYNPQYFENPTKFKPERWLSEENTLKVPKPYTWLTFSAGARSCLGKQLALTEIKIIVIQLLRKYKMTMETTDLIMKVENFSYQPQKMMTKFVKK